MHEVDEEPDVVHRGLRHDAVAQVEDVAGAAIDLGQQPLRLTRNG